MHLFTPRRLLQLVQPRLQVRLMLAFGALSATGLLLQHLLFMLLLTRAAESLPSDNQLLLDQLGPMLLTILVGSSLVLLPLLALVGILGTRRWAGPLYRFETFLQQILDGQRPGDMRLRAGDELTRLCDLLNQTTAPLRVAPTSGEQAGPSQGDAPQAA